jgi:hypothetical protein
MHLPAIPAQALEAEGNGCLGEGVQAVETSPSAGNQRANYARIR